MTHPTLTRKSRPGLPLRIRYVQAWVENGLARHYFRRRGQPRVQLPGLPGSPEFMAAYQAAFSAAPTAIGATRSKAGSVAAAIASYYGTRQASRRSPPPRRESGAPCSRPSGGIRGT
jgi:hypothetical protein